MGTGTSALRLSEAIEDVGQESRADPHPRVLDGNLGVAIGALEAHFDTTLSRRELDRVGQQVPHDLLQAVRVAAHGHGGRATGRPEGDRLGLRRRADGRQGRSDAVTELTWATVQTPLPVHDPRLANKMVVKPA